MKNMMKTSVLFANKKMVQKEDSFILVALAEIMLSQRC
jgi:hypothetical protein